MVSWWLNATDWHEIGAQNLLELLKNHENLFGLGSCPKKAKNIELN